MTILCQSEENKKFEKALWRTPVNKSVENVENSQLSTGISGFCIAGGLHETIPDSGAELRKSVKINRRIPRLVTNKLLEFFAGKVASSPVKIVASPDASFKPPKSL